MSTPLLQVENLKKFYPVRGGVFLGQVAEVQAVNDVSLEINAGETLGLVGESGCGKSTLGRTIMRLEKPSAGSVHFMGIDMATAGRRQLFEQRRHMQMIFQDPYSSLNPRMTVGDLVREPLTVHAIGNRKERVARAAELLDSVGLGAMYMDRFPHELSGGQRQRVAIARSIALGPKLVVADEPVSALDVSVQAQVLNLLVRFQRERGLAYLFISHDLGVVRYISDRVAIMYLGRIVEIGTRDEVFNNPRHPYTRVLLDSIPVPDPRRRRENLPVRGETPSPINPPPGCPFHPRCPFAIDACRAVVPPLEPVAEGASQRAACIRKHEI